MAPRTPGDEAQGRVKGGDGARSPKPSPDQGGFHPAPGENPSPGEDLVPGNFIHRNPGNGNPQLNSRVVGTEAGLHIGITPTKPGRGNHNRLHTGGQ